MTTTLSNRRLSTMLEETHWPSRRFLFHIPNDEIQATGVGKMLVPDLSLATLALSLNYTNTLNSWLVTG
jgi:hypothetical protein